MVSDVYAPWTGLSVHFTVDDSRKTYTFAYNHFENDDVREFAMHIFEGYDWPERHAPRIAETLFFIKDQTAHLKFSVQQLIQMDVEVGQNSARIETDRFGSLQINYDTQYVAQLSLHFGVIVNEKEYFAFKTDTDETSSHAYLKILDTVDILDIETGFDNWRPNDKFEIKHCKMDAIDFVEEMDDLLSNCNGENIDERFSIVPTGVLHPWLAHRAEFSSNGETTELWSFSFIQDEGDFKFKLWLYIAEANFHIKWDGMTSDCDHCALMFNAEFTGDSFETITVETDHTFQKENPRVLSEIKVQNEGYVYFYEKMSVKHEKDFYTTIEAATQISNGETMTSSLDVRETESKIGLPKFTYTLSNNNFYQPWILEHAIGGETIMVKVDTQMTSEFGFSADLDCDLPNHPDAGKKCVMNTWSRDSREHPEYNSKLKSVLETSSERMFFHVQHLEESEAFDWFKADIQGNGGNLTSIRMKSLGMKSGDYHSEYFFSADLSDVTTINIYQTETQDASPVGQIFYFRGNEQFFEMSVLPILELMDLEFFYDLPRRYYSPKKDEVYKIEYKSDVLTIEHWNGLASIVFENQYMGYLYLIRVTSPTFENNPNFELRMVPFNKDPLIELSSDEKAIRFVVNTQSLEEDGVPSGIESFAGQNFEIFNLKSKSHEIDSSIGIDLTDFAKGSYKFYSKYHHAETKFDFEQSFEHGLVKASLAVQDADGKIENGNGNFNLRYGQDDENVTKGNRSTNSRAHILRILTLAEPLH